MDNYNDVDKDRENDQVADNQEDGNRIQKKERRGRSWTTLVAVVLLISFMGGFAGAYMGNSYFSNQDSTNQYVSDPITINPNDSITAVSAVAKKSMSSVVGITTVETQEFWFSQQDVSGVGMIKSVIRAPRIRSSRRLMIRARPSSGVTLRSTARCPATSLMRWTPLDWNLREP